VAQATKQRTRHKGPNSRQMVTEFLKTSRPVITPTIFEPSLGFATPLLSKVAAGRDRSIFRTPLQLEQRQLVDDHPAVLAADREVRVVELGQQGVRFFVAEGSRLGACRVAGEDLQGG